MLELTEIALFLPRLPKELEGVRVVQLADLHVKRYGRLERRVQEVVRAGCDLLVCTGDTCSELQVPNPLARWCKGGRRMLVPPRVDQAIDVCGRLLGDFQGRGPAIFLQGNHDPDEFVDRVRQLGAWVLTNETRQVELAGVRINVCGAGRNRREYADVAQTLLGMDAELFTLGLCHYPEMAEALAAAGVDLILAGHTHGGQVCLPGGWPVVTHSRTGRRYCAGLAPIGDSVLYTSRGVGTSVLGPRVFCPAEVVRFTLRRGAAEDTQVRVKSL